METILQNVSFTNPWNIVYKCASKNSKFPNNVNSAKDEWIVHRKSM